MKKILQWLKGFIKFLIKMLQSVLVKSKSSNCSCDMPPPKLPDPFLYSQYYYLSMGLPVTWGNPDIDVFQGSVQVNTEDLQPSTAYTIRARIWNNSTDVPVVGLKVNFSYLSFGIATQSNPIGMSTTDLNVKGLPGCPAYAYMDWITPALGGHYCLQVLLEPPSDSNWLNNLGQHNVHVAQANSPAVFSFLVGNHDSPRVRSVKFTTDSYVIPPLRECGTTKAEAKNPALIPVPVHDGWTVVITPETLSIPPGEEQQVQVSITPKAGFTGIAPVNITGWDSARPLGGVTLNVEVI
jgi:hypothetical protein